MVDQATTSAVEIFHSPGLVLEAAPLEAWIQISSRAPAAHAAKAIATSLGQEPGLRVGSVCGTPGSPAILTDGPGRWLIRYPRDSRLPTDIALCALTDISDSLLGVRARGPLALALLATGCPLDLDASGAAHPACARSLFHHIPLLLHRLGEQTLDLFVPRSYLAEFEHALLVAAHGLSAWHGQGEER